MVEEKGWQLLLVDGKYSVEEECQVIQYLLDLCCDVIMIYLCFLSVDEIDDIIDVYSQLIMVFNCCLCKNSSYSVWCDYKQISFNVVVELINVGYQEIVFFIGLMDFFISVECFVGYKDVLVQYGIVFNEKFIVNGKWMFVSGVEGVEMLFECGVKFSVLVVSNDDMVIGVMKVLYECGVVVLEQVLVIGFDDIVIVFYIVLVFFSVKILVIEMIQEIIGWLIFMFDGGVYILLKIFSGKLICCDLFIAFL